MSYTNQATIEDILKRDLTAEEQSLLDSVLTSVDAYIDDVVGGSFGSVEETTRYYDGGSQFLEIDTCINITDVSEVDEIEGIANAYVENEDFEARPRNEDYKTYLEKRGGRFPCGVANIKVTAQFTENLSIPDDIGYLAAYLGSQFFSSALNENLKSESIEGYSRVFNSFLEENQTMKIILDKYIKNDVMI